MEKEEILCLFWIELVNILEYKINIWICLKRLFYLFREDAKS